MIRLVILGGTGDVYLIAALYRAFLRHHKVTTPCTLVLREKFKAIVDLFGDIPCQFDEDTVRRAEDDIEFQDEYPNPFLNHTQPFYAHPCMLRSQTRVDHLTTKPDVSQADMYRMILRLPPETPLDLPAVPQPHEPSGVLLIRDAVSWPNTQPRFWDLLAAGLRASGHGVVENDKTQGLGTLLNACLHADWVIAPQCGVMSILCTAQFPCRKTLCTPTVDHVRAPGFLARETYPYGYVTKFDGRDYDVEEFKVTETNHADLVKTIVNGANAKQLWPHDPSPVTTLMAPMTPGDALDRLAILQVKRNRFPPKRRASIEREYQRYAELCRVLLDNNAVRGLYGQLVDSHDASYLVLDRLIPAVMWSQDAVFDPSDHVRVIRFNRARFDLKRRIDAVIHTPYREVKDYYGPDDGT